MRVGEREREVARNGRKLHSIVQAGVVCGCVCGTTALYRAFEMYNETSSISMQMGGRTYKLWTGIHVEYWLEGSHAVQWTQRIRIPGDEFRIESPDS